MSSLPSQCYFQWKINATPNWRLLLLVLVLLLCETRNIRAFTLAPLLSNGLATSSRPTTTVFRSSSGSDNSATAAEAAAVEPLTTPTSSQPVHRNHLIEHVSAVVSKNASLISSPLSNYFFAMRHGQSQANVEQIIASQLENAGENYGLSSPTGFEQAQQAGNDIIKWYRKNNKKKGLQGICILHSDLLRAQQTAETILTAIDEENGNTTQRRMIPVLANTIHSEEALRERNFGSFELTNDTNYELVWKEDALDGDHTQYGVESVNSVMDRVTSCIVKWDKLLQNHMIICVAHGDVLQILQTAMMGLDGSLHRTMKHLQTATLRPLECKITIPQ